MPPTLGDRVIHIQDAIAAIRHILKNRTLEEFSDDLLLRVGTERLLEIISEASRFIPEETKTGATSINWRRLADLGKQLRHAYHRIEPARIRVIVQNDLDPLEVFVQTLVVGKIDPD
jgi:uncharacterized protein with HEPN domain